MKIELFEVASKEDRNFHKFNYKIAQIYTTFIWSRINGVDSDPSLSYHKLGSLIKELQLQIEARSMITSSLDTSNVLFTYFDREKVSY